MNEYINVAEAAKLIRVTPTSLYKIINHEDTEKRLEPINRLSHHGEGGYRFRYSDVQVYIDKYGKKDLTPSDAAQQIKRSVSYIHKLIHEGTLPSYEGEYRGKKTFFIKAGDLEQFVENNPDTGKVPALYDKRLSLFLFQPFIRDGQLGRVMQLKRVSKKKVEAFIVAEDGEWLNYEDAIGLGWEPQLIIKDKKPINGYGYARFEFPYSKRVDSIIYSVIETLFEHAGPANIKIDQDEKMICLEVRKCILKGILPSTHPDLLKELGVFMKSGKLIPVADGTLIDTGLFPVQAFLTEKQKKALMDEADAHNMHLQDWVLHRLTLELPTTQNDNNL